MLSNIQAGQIGFTGRNGQNGQNGPDWSKRKLQNNQAHSKLPKLNTYDAHHAHHAHQNGKRKPEPLHANTTKHARPKMLHPAKRHITWHKASQRKRLRGGTNDSDDHHKILLSTSVLLNEKCRDKPYWAALPKPQTLCSDYTCLSTADIIACLKTNNAQYTQLDIPRNPTIEYKRNDDYITFENARSHLLQSEWTVGLADDASAECPDTYLRSLKLESAGYNVGIDDLYESTSKQTIFQSLQKFAWAFGIGIAWLSAELQQPVFINCWSTTMFLVYTHNECESVCQALWVLLSDRLSTGSDYDDSVNTHVARHDGSPIQQPRSFDGRQDSKSNAIIVQQQNTRNQIQNKLSFDSDHDNANTNAVAQLTNEIKQIKQYIDQNDKWYKPQWLWPHSNVHNIGGQKYTLIYSKAFVLDKWNEECIRLKSGVFTYKHYFIVPVQHRTRRNHE